MSDKPVKVCPKCKARKVEKLISHTSFQLKGGGWYKDLYASQKPGGGTTPSEAGAGKAGKEGAADTSTSTTHSKESTDSKDSKQKGKKGAAKAAA